MTHDVRYVSREQAFVHRLGSPGASQLRKLKTQCILRVCFAGGSLLASSSPSV